MSEKYKFYNKEDLYFVTLTVVNWIDVFTRNVYKDALLDSWKYCIREKGLVIHAWCIMTNHVHMIISSEENELSDIMRDMKSYTSTTIRKLIIENAEESRKEWMLKMMIQKGEQNKNNIDFQLWQQHNYPIVLDSNYLKDQKLNYIHNNPVKAGFVEEPEDYLYSSARDYCGIQGLVEIVMIE
jgi:REP element-mobilizing transposase RayT